jgi:hypothetical protein
MVKFGIDSNMVFDANGKSVAARLSDHDTSLADNTSKITDISNKLLNPEMFRYDGGTIFNDTDSFNRVLTYAYTNGKEVHLYKDYVLTNITITGTVVIEGHGHSLTDSVTGNIFVQVSSTGFAKFKNVNVFCSKSNYGLYNNDGLMDLENVSVQGSLIANVRYVKLTIHGSGEVNYLQSKLSPTGLDLSASDVKVRRYQGFNCKTHINVAGGGVFLDNCHGWNMKDSTWGDYVTGSIFINVGAGASFIFNDCYADTTETAIQLPTGGPFTLINGNNFIYFLNRTYYPDGVATPPKLLRNVDAFTGQFSITNLQTDNSAWKDGSGNQTQLFDGTLVASRMTIRGLTNNGYLDQNYIIPKTGDLFSYLSGESSSYFSPFSRKYYIKDNQKYIYIAASMSASIPTGSVAYTATLLTPFNIMDGKTRGRAFVDNAGTIY